MPTDVDATCDEIAVLLEVDPEDVLKDGDRVSLSNAQARRLLALARKAAR